MAKQVINIGAAPNDGTGTPLRTSFDYTNQNFTELYNGSGIGTSTNTQVLFNDSGVANGDAGLVYNKTTDALSVGGALGVTGAATLSSTLAVTGTSTLTGAATVQGLTLGKGNGAIASNTAFGVTALPIVTGDNCTAVGNSALKLLTVGTRNTALGSLALTTLVSGDNNTGLGLAALQYLASGSRSTGVGDTAAYQSTGSDTTAVGNNSLGILIAGNANTAIGSSAGSAQTAGSNNGFFGAGSYGDSPTASNSYNYGDGSVTTHKFRNGNLVVANGRIDVGGASAALRITSSTGDMYQTVASKLTSGNITSITVVFTVSNYSGNTVMVDAQLVGFQSLADFCLGKYATQATQVLRTNASAGITATLTESSGIHTFTITIGSPSTIELALLNLKVLVGGGFATAPTFTVLPVVTFI